VPIAVRRTFAGRARMPPEAAPLKGPPKQPGFYAGDKRALRDIVVAGGSELSTASCERIRRGRRTRLAAPHDCPLAASPCEGHHPLLQMLVRRDRHAVAERDE